MYTAPQCDGAVIRAGGDCQQVYIASVYTMIGFRWARLKRKHRGGTRSRTATKNAIASATHKSTTGGSRGGSRDWGLYNDNILK